MPIRVAINGFGRIGRLVLRAICDQGLLGKVIDVAAVVDVSSDVDYFAYLIKHDSVHGNFIHHVSVVRDELNINGHRIKCLVSPNAIPDLPWKELGVNCVIDATGLLSNGDQAYGHIKAGADKVFITAPAQGSVKTIVIGVNEHEYDPQEHHIISAASCTTHCLSMLLHVLIREGIGIETGLVTAINSYTASQKVTDGFSRRDWRSGRAAAANIIPSKTSASKIALDVFPQLKGRLSGISFRVPTLDVSMVDFTFRSERETSIKEIDLALKRASETYLKGFLGFTNEELVSTDFIHDSHSSIYDSSATIQSNVDAERRLFRLISWYDNEWGYSNRIVDLVKYLHLSDKESNNLQGRAYAHYYSF